MQRQGGAVHGGRETENGQQCRGMPAPAAATCGQGSSACLACVHAEHPWLTLPHSRPRPIPKGAGSTRLLSSRRNERTHPIPNHPSSDDSLPPDASSQPKTDRARTLGLGGLLFELVLPVALSAAILLAAASYIPVWDLQGAIGLGIFGFLLVLLSLLISVRVDGFTLARRRKRGKRQLLNRAGPWSRLVKFILGGVVIPIATLAAANLVELPGHRTPMALAIQLRTSKPAVGHAAQLGNAVLRAGSPATKVEGIVALQAMNSSAALDQLLRILSDDPAALKNGSECQALSKALASFGAQAKPKLLQRFSEIPPGVRRGAAGACGDLFERFFSVAFEGAKSEISRRITDPASQAAQLARLQDAQAELQHSLRQVETDASSGHVACDVPGFVLQTFLQMGVTHDAELLAFARRTAADATWSEAVRGQALLLLAKLGGKDDLDDLFAYLGDRSPLVQARAMQAIAMLHAKLAQTGDKG